MMKYLFFAAIVIFLSIPSQAQQFALAGAGNAAINLLDPIKGGDNFQYKKHCTATKVGGIMMIAGGATTLTGIVMLVSPISKDNDKGHGEGYKTSEEVALAGVSVTVIGGLVYLLGKEEDRNNKRRFEILSQKNKLGLVYKF